MALERKILLNTNTVQWDKKYRYKINSVTKYNNSLYQNITGFNAEPGTTEDWIFIKELENITGFNDSTDLTTMSLTGGADNLLTFTGTTDQNGDLGLLNNDLEIKPSGLNDIITIDIAFTIIVPVGTNHYINVFLQVGADVYRSSSPNITKGVGLDDNISVSWVLPVKESFLLNKGKIYLNPSVSLDIKNKYICVTRVGKGLI